MHHVYFCNNNTETVQMIFFHSIKALSARPDIELANIVFCVLCVNGSHAISPILKLAKCFFADSPNIMLSCQ